MSSDLLRYYNEELRFLRQQGREFAERHPQIAARLTLDDESSDSVRDPHVERLLQGVAFLNARTRLKLDDDFPEITEALLNVVAPHYSNPAPAMAIAEARLAPAQAGMTQGLHLPRGTILESAPLPDGEPLRFRTAYALSLWPATVADAALEHRPFAAPETPAARSAQAVLRLRLQSFKPDPPLGEQAIAPLRLHLSGQAPFIYDLYELLLTGVTGVSVAAPGATQAVQLPAASTIRRVGFEPEDAAIPSSPRTLPGHTLLSEFFIFPQKFLFLDLHIPPEVWSRQGAEAEILLFLDREATELAPSVSRTTFRMGCTPVVNLYSQTAEPIRVTRMQSDYRIVPDARRPGVHEVYSVDRVTAVDSAGASREVHPLYSFRREDATGTGCFWIASRRTPAGAPRAEEGSDLHLSLADLDFHPTTPDAITLNVETTCVTRDPLRLRDFEGGLPRVQPVKHDRSLMTMQCITRPTSVLRPALGRGTRWRLLSHLAVNGLSLQDFEAGADGLRELLRLYNLRDDKRASEMIAGIAGVRFERTTGRIREVIDGRRHEFLCRGQHVTVDFDESRYSAGGLYLFASVLERFLGAYCSLNSFVRMSAISRQRGMIAQWPRRAGDQVLL
ncbi:MAG: type VI secretion system baseplate subunit TssF [Planctomyces sp.]|nr:type VI secretion system baseplate subunit TssF [Planctomyces sp.]